ncbi:type 1 glutamine amidotransferase [Ectopseudomonas mendocina]|uniref:Type 1 glutamine amidotransferase n=1 Tax=Ectopseudomonas mendocina TaxID=300 RepID=A0ABZ2RDG9_ECTME
MTDILIFTHTEYCPPAHLGEVLDNGGYTYQVLRADQNQLDGLDLDKPKAVAIMGGPMSVNDPLPWLHTEVAAIRYLLKREVPMVGHCLGGQLIAKALGAPITSMGYTESGWQPMSRLDQAQPSPWLEHVPDTFTIFQWHGDTFAIPEGAQPLLSSPWCPNQGFAWGEKVLALQGHPEMTEALITEWLTDWYHLLDPTQPSQQSKAQMQAQLQQKVSELNKVAQGFYRRWLALAGLNPRP